MLIEKVADFVCRMNKDVINLCYYFSCKIFALDHW